MVKYILIAIGIYLLYQFIFRLVIPVYLATRKIKSHIRDMQEKMNEQYQQQQAEPQQASAGTSANGKAPAGDYIDFEEVK